MFLGVLHSLHVHMMARLIDNEDISEFSPVFKGVEQGCVPAPTLFSLLLA